MTTPADKVAPTEAEWLDERDRLQSQAIDVLARTVRLTRPPVSPGETVGELEDFAGFLAEVLAAVAANVGGTWRVTAGRPGSWEADLVHQLIAGTVGHDDKYLMAYRTEPVRVPLNVAQLVDEDGPFADPPVVPLDQAFDALWIAHEEEAGEVVSDDEAEAAWQAIEAAEADLTARYRMTFTAYAQVFTAAVTQAARTIDGLSAPIEMVTEIDPEAWAGPPQNPTLFDHDRLVWRLWSTAYQQVGLPRP